VEIYIGFIDNVPPGQSGSYGRIGLGTLSEHAKLREIVNKSARLLSRVSPLVETVEKKNTILFSRLKEYVVDFTQLLDSFEIEGIKGHHWKLMTNTMFNICSMHY
jgi:hypothetical protein